MPPTTNPFGALDTLADTAAAGDRDVTRHLLDVIWPIAVRRCRAELDSTTADSMARAASSTALRAVPQPGPLAALPGPERAVLILRLVVGLSVDDTATSLGRTSAEVLLDQHRALQKLREDGLTHQRRPPPRQR
ncbi:hypothetical protein [Rhodococcus sp. NPDC057529]|uniref:hypothetical protein n=1 Tax=Rhodococcus sp. NPDC057529 TaxID=3346158 RepID=UPI003672364A